MTSKCASWSIIVKKWCFGSSRFPSHRWTTKRTKEFLFMIWKYTMLTKVVFQDQNRPVLQQILTNPSSNWNSPKDSTAMSILTLILLVIYLKKCGIMQTIHENLCFLGIFRISMIINEPYKREYENELEDEFEKFTAELVKTIESILSLKLNKFHSAYFLSMEWVVEICEKN